MQKVITLMLLLLSLTATITDTHKPTELYIESSRPIIVTSYTNNMNKNNPFNIRYNIHNDWLGVVRGKTHNDFEEFTEMRYGLRAGLKLLLRYYNGYGLHTIRDIITKFAPPTENDTEVYIAYVARQVGVEPDDEIDLNKKATLISVAKWMLKMETGKTFANAQLVEAYALLFLT